MTKKELLQAIEEAEMEESEAASKAAYLKSQLEDGDYDDAEEE